MQVGKEFALLFSVLFLPGIVSQGASIDPSGFERVAYHLLVLAVALPQLLIVLYVSDLRIPGSSLRFGWRAPSWKDAGTAALTYLGVMGGAITISAIIGAISTFLPEIESAFLPRVMWRFSAPALIPLALISSLAVGYREEVFFRAYLINRSSEIGVSTVGAVGGGAVLFAVGHLYQGVAGFVVALLLGVALGAIYARTRSLHGVAIAHGLYNLTILLISGTTSV